jgi:hypothetical protein
VCALDSRIGFRAIANSHDPCELDSNAVNWLWLAQAQNKLGNYDAAIGYFENAELSINAWEGHRPANSEAFGWHRHYWPEAHILLREIESLLTPSGER